MFTLCMSTTSKGESQRERPRPRPRPRQKLLQFVNEVMPFLTSRSSSPRLKMDPTKGNVDMHFEKIAIGPCSITNNRTCNAVLWQIRPRFCRWRRLTRPNFHCPSNRTSHASRYATPPTASRITTATSPGASAITCPTCLQTRKALQPRAPFLPRAQDETCDLGLNEPEKEKELEADASKKK
jgi:hypothetical protein